MRAYKDKYVLISLLRKAIYLRLDIDLLLSKYFQVDS